jgi:hypothetical protein
MIAAMSCFLLRPKSGNARASMAALKRSLAERPEVAIREETADALVVEVKGERLELDPIQREIWRIHHLRSTGSLLTQPVVNSPARPLLKLRAKRHG